MKNIFGYKLAEFVSDYSIFSIILLFEHVIKTLKRKIIHDISPTCGNGCSITVNKALSLTINNSIWNNSRNFSKFEKVHSKGGILLLINRNLKIMIEFSNFIDSSVENGYKEGVIYIQVLSSKLKKNCALNCCTI